MRQKYKNKFAIRSLRKVSRATLGNFFYWTPIRLPSRSNPNWRLGTAKFCVPHCILRTTTPSQNQLLLSSIKKNSCQEKAHNKATFSVWQNMVSQFFYWLKESKKNNEKFTQSTLIRIGAAKEEYWRYGLGNVLKNGKTFPI